MKKTRLQLVGILILVALLPLVPTVFTARALFNRSLDPLLETGILEGARAGLTSTRELLAFEKSRFHDAIASDAALDTLTAGEMAALDPRERSAIDAWERAPKSGERLSSGRTVLIPPERFPLGGDELLIARIAGDDGVGVWVTSPLPPELAERAATLTESIRLVETVRRERGSVIRSLVSTFLVVYGGLLVIVLVSGLYLASRVTRPIAALGRGIRRVAAGDLDSRVPIEAGGELATLLTNFNDMTTRLRTQQTELVRLEKIAAWRQMSRRLAHEIKNPLTPIQLAAEQMRDTYPGSDAEHRRFLDEACAIIQEEVEALRSLVAEFSQFARMPEPQLDWVDASELVGEVTGLYGDDKVSARVTPTAPARIRCDSNQIHRALINLVSNALEAQSEIGRTEPVEITLEGGRWKSESGEARALHIRVFDRGPGVPEAERRRIFEPDVTSKSQGMGLGLAIVENTIERHGGVISVDDRDGGGAVFTVTLPVPSEETEGDTE